MPREEERAIRREMTLKIPLFLAAAMLLTLPNISNARDYGEVAGWQLASSGSSCGIYSSRAGNGEIIFLKNLSGDVHIHISNKFWKVDEASDLRFKIDGKPWRGRFGIAPHTTENRPGYVAAFDSAIVPLLRAGRQLSVERGNVTLAIFSLSGSAAALNRLEFCLTDLRRDGPAPVQTAAEIAKRTIIPPRPATGAGRWFNLSDYPKKAQREGREGTVEFRLTVDAKGRVSRCDIAASSGHKDIDESTCKAVTKRARFTPAQDGTGKKVSGNYQSRVTWRVPK